MNANQKKNQLNRGLSVALALLIVAAVVVTVIAVVSAKRGKPPVAETTASNTATTKAPEVTTRPPLIETTTNGTDTPIVAEKVTFISPLTKANISKEWSAEIPVFSDTMEDYRVHLGVDLEADAGTPVYAAADGYVESVVFDPMMGQSVTITHAAGYKTVYKNLQTGIPEGIAEGNRVTAGTQIGSVGDTALVEISQAPHLHFELYAGEKNEDPLTHIQVAPIDAATYYED